ncbi:MAG: hypothetical protein RR562_04730 [Longicatena sp.]
METAVHFGAGAIGRGLLGDLLYESGYQIVFVDTMQKLIDQINETNSFTLIEMELGNHRKVIDHVQALHSIDESDKVIDVIAEALILTTSVRVENLKRIAPVIGKGLLKRLEKGVRPIDILAFENAYRASDTLKEEILKCTPELNEETIGKVACFANTITDRVVMNIEEDGKSIIQVGDTFEAAIEQDRLYDPTSKPIKDGSYTNNINLALDRKLFVVNGGHCACGYLGNLRGYTIMMDGFTDPEVYKEVRDQMCEVGKMLRKKHNIDYAELAEYIEFALERYLSSKNTDYVVRVCRNPIRKLHPNDRLSGPAIQAMQLGMPYQNIARAIAAAFTFDSLEDEESQQIQDFIRNEGIEKAITNFTTIPSDTDLFACILQYYKDFKK